MAKSSSQIALLLLAMFLIANSLCSGDCRDFSGMFVASTVSVSGGGRSLLEVNDPTNQKSTMRVPHDDHEKSHQDLPTGSSTSARDDENEDVASEDRQFGMAAHEVPSGPNPESN
ncbi:OLC1v1019262C1 [Oldenlandia corymbosa var. corymbosa]|uniref:OLC1v1019262C1 n=1 Tax=Oldenlandia corymbosa var. corymbosa TaxID=529605 RepID=A0AAV1EDM2_OLDCO|nr:OLC1v1019262C1 [Oldenlandia corymbosa var. corymbosa]